MVHAAHRIHQAGCAARAEQARGMAGRRAGVTLLVLTRHGVFAWSIRRIAASIAGFLLDGA